MQAAIEEAVPADVLTAALYARFRSRQEHTFAEKMLSAMRNKFGGHVERQAAEGAMDDGSKTYAMAPGRARAALRPGHLRRDRRPRPSAS